MPHRLGCGQAYVRQLIHRGELRAIRIGKRWRVDERDLEAFIQASRTTTYSRR
jgi:excisionase family DNA binding protein